MTGEQTETSRILNLYLAGPMRVTDGQGQKLVIRGRKAQALLALTALAPQMQRSRVWLRDKLWSQSDETRSSTSLRQSLFELRRDLGPKAEAALDITTDTVGLNSSRVWVDVTEVQRDAALFSRLGLTEETELLEGLDIGDPEFEDWLQAARFDWADTAEALAAVRPARLLLSEKGLASSTRLCVALMRGVVQGGDEMTHHLSDFLTERIIDNIRELMPVQVIDLRSRTAPIEDLAESAEAEFFCRMRVLCIGRNVTLTFFVYRSSQLAIEWSQSIQCALEELQQSDSMLLQGFVAQNTDRLAKTLLSHIPASSDETVALRAGHTALNLLFRLDDDALGQALELLDKAEAANKSNGAAHSLTAGLRAYAASFAVGENLGNLGMDERQRLHHLINAQLEDNPFNAITLACLGHVIGYVFQEHDLAGKVLERAVALNPSQAFAWDHLALHKLYTGDYKEVLRLAQRATQLGAFSPISYTYDTTLAMAATLSGDFARAALAGRSALQKQPRYKAAMRYLMVAQSASGQRAAAEETRTRLLQLDPEFADPKVQLMRFGLRDVPESHPLLLNLKPLME
ncbi:MAG: transcriptional regulator [Roseinatronobacter sp.]